MSKPVMSGVNGQNVIFRINNKVYTTTAVLASDVGSLTVKQATALVASGQATPAAKSYLSEYPWTMT